MCKTEIEQIDNVIANLKLLKLEINAKNKKSYKALNCNGTPKQRQKASVDLTWQCMTVDKQRKAVWKAMLPFEVSIEDCEYNPSGFHNYKHTVK